MPFFSVLIPVYNVQSYLEECLNSVLNQEFNDFEIILVDDGSTDNSGIICDKFSRLDCRVKTFHNKNHGLLFTRRFAISKSSGSFLIHLDSDDYLEPNALLIIHKKIEMYNCDCVIYGLKRFDNQKYLKPYSSPFKKDVVFENKKELYKTVLSSFIFNSLCRKCSKREIVGNNDFSGKYHIKYGEDLIQSLEIYASAKRVAIIKDDLYNYRMNPESMLHTKKINDMDMSFELENSVLNFALKENCFNDKEFSIFKSHCVRTFTRTLKFVCGCDDSKETKIRCLNTLFNTTYIQNFLIKGRYFRRIVGLRFVVFDLFKAKKFERLIRIISLYNKIKK